MGTFPMLTLQRSGVGKTGIQKKLGGAGEMPALSEDPGLILSTHMAVHNCQQFKFPWI